MTYPVWMGISSGTLIDLAHPQTTDIDIEDIARSLANIMRFNGHLETQISVARHSLEVSYLVPTELALAALLHDAHEAYVGDVVRPVKRFLMLRGVDLDEYEGVWQNLVWLRYDCLPTTDERQLIMEADDLQLAREITSLAPEGPFRGYGRALLNKHAGHKRIELLDLGNCGANPRRDYVSFKKRFFELDGTEKPE